MCTWNGDFCELAALWGDAGIVLFWSKESSADEMKLNLESLLYCIPSNRSSKLLFVSSNRDIWACTFWIVSALRLTSALSSFIHVLSAMARWKHQWKGSSGNYRMYSFYFHTENENQPPRVQCVQLEGLSTIVIERKRRRKRNVHTLPPLPHYTFSPLNTTISWLHNPPTYSWVFFLTHSFCYP